MKLVFVPRTTLTVTEEVRFCTISVLCGENPVMTPPVGTVGVVVGVFVGVEVGVDVDVAVLLGVRV